MNARTEIIDHAIIERCLAQIAAWQGWVPEPPPSTRQPIYAIELQGPGDSDIRRLRGILKTLLRRYAFRCIAAREVVAQAHAGAPSALHDAPRRAPVAVRITREDKAWLVVVGAHGWLHGDKRSALADAQWLAGNFGLPVRRANREDSA
jgi:hypothetical protein